jgi:hypothetical protein
MSVLKLPLLVDLQPKVGELVLSVTSCPSTIILYSTLKQCTEKRGYGNFNHRHNVPPIHLHAFIGVGNFTKVIHVCADRYGVVRDCRNFEKQCVRPNGQETPPGTNFGN